MSSTDPAHLLTDALERARKVLITTHVRPDGDALGTATAMALALRERNIDSTVLLLSRLPRKYSFLLMQNKIDYVAADPAFPDLDINTFDTLLVVDTGTRNQLPLLEERLDAFQGRKLVLDHHQTQEAWADVKLVDTSAAAAGEIAERLIEMWGVALTQPIAEALFVAITSDTGWFQFANTSAETMHRAARLMEAGVDTDRIYQALYQNERAERVYLQTRALQSLQLEADGKLAVMCVRAVDFEQTHADVPDTENIINYPMQIRTVQVSVLVVEPRDGGPVRISLRSKGQVDVAQFAEELGGGGHARAAGCKLTGDVQAVRDQVMQRMVARLTQG